MFYYKLTVQYKGTSFYGWQVQDNVRTIQGELNSALKKICKSDNALTIASGRTDAGVHSLGQVCKVTMPLSIAPESLKLAINSLIDDDIRVACVESSNELFHPIRDSIWKEYWYCFCIEKRATPILNDVLAYCPYKDVSVEKMREACVQFVGSKNFEDFYCTGSEVHSFVRNIEFCTLERYKYDSNLPIISSDTYILKIRGNGFLKQMVRLIVGTVWNVGRNKISLSQLESSLAGVSQGKLGSVAPPEGLYLREVSY